MGAKDKFDNAAEEKAGKAKEAFGRATGDEETEAEGKAESAKAGLKQAGHKVKDALS